MLSGKPSTFNTFHADKLRGIPFNWSNTVELHPANYACSRSVDRASMGTVGLIQYSCAHNWTVVPRISSTPKVFRILGLPLSSSVAAADRAAHAVAHIVSIDRTPVETKTPAREGTAASNRPHRCCFARVFRLSPSLNKPLLFVAVARPSSANSISWIVPTAENNAVTARGLTTRSVDITTVFPLFAL